MRKVKGSTLIEAVVATLIIVTSFMGMMVFAAGVHKRAAGFMYYGEMIESRDSVLASIMRGAEPNVILERDWGVLDVSGSNGQVCITASLKSGQRYTVYYLVDEK